MRFATIEGRLLDFCASIFDRAMLDPRGGATYAVVAPRTAPSGRTQNGSAKEKLCVDGGRFDGTESLISRFVGEK